MSRYPLVALLGVVAVGLLSLGLYGRADDKRAAGAATADHAHAGHFMDCAKACHACARECDACSTHCAKLIAEGKKEHLATLRSCQDCAAVCATAAAITARKGPYSEQICKACEEVCKRCAEACEKFKDDKMMRQCAEECRRCEKACREMLKHAGHGSK